MNKPLNDNGQVIRNKLKCQPAEFRSIDMTSCPNKCGGTLSFANGDTTCNVCGATWQGTPHQVMSGTAVVILSGTVTPPTPGMTIKGTPASQVAVGAAKKVGGAILAKMNLPPISAAAPAGIGKGAVHFTYGISNALAKSAIGKKIKNNIIPLLVLVAVGAIVSTGIPAIPFLGIPHITAPYIGLAIILWGMLYIFPTEGEVMQKVREENTVYTCMKVAGHTVDKHGVCQGKTSLGRPCPGPTKATEIKMGMEHWGPLYARGMIEVLAVVLVMFDLVKLSLLVSLVFAFVMYFRLPEKYKQDQPYKAATAWLRTGIGLAIAYLLVTFLSPNASTTFMAMLFGPTIFFIAIFFVFMMIINLTMTKYGMLKWVLMGVIIGAFLTMNLFSANLPPQMALMWFALAFYAVTPGRESQADSFKRTNMVITMKGNAGKISDFMESRQAKWEDFGTAVFVSFMMLGGIPMLTGWLSGSGQLQITITVIWLISLMTGVVGGRTSRPYIGSVMMIFAVFSFSAAYSDTVGTAVFGQYWGNVQAGADVLFGPMSDAANRGSCEAYASYLCISEGPSKCEAEKLKCERLNSEPVGSDKSIEFEEITGPPEFDPYQNTTLSYTFSNAGEFDAQDVTLEMTDPPSVLRVEGVQAKEPTDIGSIIMDDSSCIGGTYLGHNKCSWEGTFKPGARGAGIVTIKWNTANMKLGCAKGEACDKGLFPDIRFKTSYDYAVRATYAIDVRSRDELQRLLLDPTMSAQQAGIVKQYSGGPLTASLWTPKYIQSGVDTLVTASLTNTKDGTARGVDFCVFIPAEATPSGFQAGARMAKEGECDAPAGAQAIRCHWDTIDNGKKVDPNTAKPLNYKTCGFRMSIDISPAPQKQLAITGKADFTYVTETVKKDIPIAFVSEAKVGV